MKKLAWIVVASAVAWVGAACSPVFDWRDVRVAPATAALVLPCKKPDHVERHIPLGGVPTQLNVMGCEAGGATFAVMAALLPEGHEADEILAGWQQATLANMQARDGQVRRTPFRPLGGLSLPHAERVSADGLQPDGKAVHAEAAWTAHAARDGRMMLLHAVMYSQRKQDHAVDTFFETIRW